VRSSILFFQASATIISTLFVALAFTSKALAPGDNSLFGWAKSESETYQLAVTLLAIPISSEAVALATLAANRPTFVAAFCVLFGILIMLGYLLLSVTAPLRKSWYDRVGRTLGWATFVPMAVFLVVLGILTGYFS